MPSSHTASSRAKPRDSISTYYDTLHAIQKVGVTTEGGTRRAFSELLHSWAKNYSLTLTEEQTIEGTRKKNIRPDGILVDDLKLRRGYWEAKDLADDFEREIADKIKVGYPLSNTLFENTNKAVLYQDNQRQGDFDLTDAAQLRELLTRFFEYEPPQIEEFHKAITKFSEEIPNLANAMTEIIERSKRENTNFAPALEKLLLLCRESINPNTTLEQVEDMLKQHILTERIFRSIFQNPDFVRRNAVAAELEKVVAALTSKSFSRDAFLRRLDHFYVAIENTARTITDYGEKQALLNTLYERFFQAYSKKAADTNGIVYTPAEIVRWMVASVEKALQREFGQDLSSEGVHIIDPCVGTGTFMMEILQRIDAMPLEQKYSEELHANEVLLLPYYIAAQNIEHAYYERTGEYKAFDGICFVDTLDMTETPQMQMFVPENTQRIEQQKKAQIKVIIGNPPYNAGQENENDNNKNRKHGHTDDRIAKTYAKASKATLQRKLYDPYVKFFRWATDRLRDQDGIICFVSNNSFIDQTSFDGMRQHLLQDFTSIYVFDLGGNVRKNPKLSGTKNNVFGIQVGVAITLLIRNRKNPRNAGLFYARFDEFWTKEQKLKRIDELRDFISTDWKQLQPDSRNTWLTDGLKDDFTSFLPMGTKEAKAGKLASAETIFKTFSLGVNTARDDWAYNFNKRDLINNIKAFSETYNIEVFKWSQRQDKLTKVDDFVAYDDKTIKWSRNLKRDLQRGQTIKFSAEAVRKSLYRPYITKYLYFADQIIDERGTNGSFFPTPSSEQENQLICLSGVGGNKTFHTVCTNILPDYHLTGDTQCFPFYVYDEDGSNRRENITDWALQQFQAHYADESISKWDIFHYVYAVLHSPVYRAEYAENLKRDLPRIPFAPREYFAYYAGG